MAYFEHFNNSFHSVDNLHIQNFVNNIENRLNYFSEFISKNYDVDFFSFFGSSVLNTLCIIKCNKEQFILSDIDGLYFSKEEQSQIQSDLHKIKIESELFKNSLNVSIKHLSYGAHYFIEDIVFLDSLIGNKKELESRRIFPVNILNRYYSIAQFKKLPYEQLLFLWSIVKLVVKINNSKYSIVEAKYNLAKGFRKPCELNYFNINKGVFIITDNQLDNYLKDNFYRLKNFLFGISNSKPILELVNIIEKLICREEIEFTDNLKYECLNILLENINERNIESRLSHYINNFLLNEAYNCN